MFDVLLFETFYILPKNPSIIIKSCLTITKQVLDFKINCTCISEVFPHLLLVYISAKRCPHFPKISKCLEDMKEVCIVCDYQF